MIKKFLLIATLVMNFVILTADEEQSIYGHREGWVGNHACVQLIIVIEEIIGMHFHLVATINAHWLALAGITVW